MRSIDETPLVDAELDRQFPGSDVTRHLTRNFPASEGVERGMDSLRAGVVGFTLLVVIAGAGCGDDDRGVSSTATGPVVSVAPTPPAGGGELPEREADVTGLVGTGDEYPAPPHLLEPTDDYYLGMGLLRGDPIVRGADGTPMSPSELEEGDQVAVWIDGGCAESFPVQCDIVALVVTRQSS